MIKNYCLNCQTVLEEGDIKVTTVHDPFCTGDSPDEQEWACGHCNAEDIEEVNICQTCDEVPAAEGCDDCQTCLDSFEL